jgi:Xaa-Pro aminopeptidase
VARYEARRDRLRKILKKSGADALLVTNFTNVTYLTGFTGDDSYLLFWQDGQVILSDPRYATQIEEQCPGLDMEIRPPGTNMVTSIARTVKSGGAIRLGVEVESMTVGLRDRIVAELPQIEVMATARLIEELREVKDAEEIAQLREAIWYAEKAFGVLRASLTAEKTEKQVAAELEHQMRLFGARGPSFPSIVAAGARAALPHATPTDRLSGEGDILLVDWGADGGLYKSDLTRVLVTGKISPKVERIYRVVLSAQEQGIAAIRPGAVAQDVDAVARGVIEQAGFGRYFGHGLGHGLGLEVHEAPRLAAHNTVVLKPGMVVTVEPGIYMPGWGGVRIEDDVLVTRSGCEVLTSVPKQWNDYVC